ncbi:MAG: hypothetical protein AAGE85_03195 [Pseudomonadota bacterium]
MSVIHLRALSGGALIVLLLVSGSVFAQESADRQNYLDVRTVVQKEEIVVGDEGETTTRLVAADRVLPGERVVYTITFTNVGSEPADNVTVTNPIDASLTYLQGSAFGAGMRVEFSADGGQSFAAPEALRVADGNGGERSAEAEDYTHVRWTLPGVLEAGTTGVARFSAVVD